MASRESWSEGEAAGRLDDFDRTQNNSELQAERRGSNRNNGTMSSLDGAGEVPTVRQLGAQEAQTSNAPAFSTVGDEGEAARASEASSGPILGPTSSGERGGSAPVIANGSNSWPTLGSSTAAATPQESPSPAADERQQNGRSGQNRQESPAGQGRHGIQGRQRRQERHGHHEPNTVPISTDLAQGYPPWQLPQWQPDSDATHCPICNNCFTTFFRRHHCR
jgi:hypothetical protein